MNRSRTGKRQLSEVTIGLIALVVVVCVTYLGFTKAIPFQHHFTVRAAFSTANNLRKGSPVRIAGVNVGKVVGVQPVRTPGGRPAALVDMRIEDNGLPLHTDASAAIRPRIFLEGNFFIDLRPGTSSAPKLGDGGTLPVQQNTSPVQLDQILSGLQAGTRKNLQTLIEQFAVGLSGPGAQGFNRSIPYWTPAYRDSSIVNDATQGNTPGSLPGFIKDAGTTAGALDANPAALQGLITDFNTTARAFAVQQGALERTVAELPRTLHAAIPALGVLDAALPPLRRLVVDLRPAVRSSGPALDATVPLTRQLRGLVSRPELRGLVKDLRPTIPALASLNQATIPLLNQARLAASCQNSVILPWSHDTISDPNFPAKGQVFQESTKPLSGLAGETRSGDANGFWFRVLANAGNYTYALGNNQFTQSAFPFLGANPPKAQARPALRPDVPCETQSPPSLKTIVGAPPQRVATNSTSPAALRMAAWARASAARYLGQQAHARGLHVNVSPQDITPAQIQQLAAQSGHASQLAQVPSQLSRTPAQGKP